MGAPDLTFKSFLERQPYLAVRQFGGRPVRPGVIIAPVDREIALSPTQADGALILEQDGEKWIEHFESELGLSSDDKIRIPRRAQALNLRYSLPVWTTITLMSKRYGPAPPSLALGGTFGTLTVAVEARCVALWEEPPDLLIASGEVDAMPWVGAMKATAVQEEEMIRAILSVADPEERSRLSAEAITLISMRYDKGMVAEFRRRLQMVSTRELLMAGCLGEEILEEGRKEGRALGRAEGRREGEAAGGAAAARRHIRSVVAAKMPGGADLQWLDEISDPAVLDLLFEELLVARDEQAVATALVRRRP